jgi:hypothetical protein
LIIRSVPILPEPMMATGMREVVLMVNLLRLWNQ